MKLFYFIVTFLLFSYITASPAKACSCCLQDFDSANNSAAAIFVGKVISIEQLGHKERVTLDVKQSWKGSAANSKEVFTRADSDACGYFFEVGKSYLIYTYKNNDETFWVSACSRTRPRSARQAKDDSKKLNELNNGSKTKTNFSVLTGSRTIQWT